GSRFRSSIDPGVFYGSDSVPTAAAEVGFWRWKFVQESAGLDRLGPAPHTAFSAPVRTKGVDLRRPPFHKDEHVWTNPDDYAGTQTFGRVARAAGAGAIVYRSVRSPVASSWCAAILTPRAFAANAPDRGMQSWHLVVTEGEVIWRRALGEALSFDMRRWNRHPPL
ncbi:MAG TPA: RES family NAD+ phosphorylase, partial [Geobacterales bacterium]|nr:RES family NAD+ phosphorylase [Geobacterales bacterium]